MDAIDAALRHVTSLEPAEHIPLDHLVDTSVPHLKMGLLYRQVSLVQLPILKHRGCSHAIDLCLNVQEKPLAPCLTARLVFSPPSPVLYASYSVSAITISRRMNDIPS
jgi:hypothetical protein